MGALGVESSSAWSYWSSTSFLLIFALSLPRIAPVRPSHTRYPPCTFLGLRKVAVECECMVHASGEVVNSGGVSVTLSGGWVTTSFTSHRQGIFRSRPSKKIRNGSDSFKMPHQGRLTLEIDGVFFCETSRRMDSGMLFRMSPPQRRKYFLIGSTRKGTYVAAVKPSRHKLIKFTPRRSSLQEGLRKIKLECLTQRSRTIPQNPAPTSLTESEAQRRQTKNFKRPNINPPNVWPIPRNSSPSR